MEQTSEVDAIIDQLKADSVPTSPRAGEEIETPKLTDDNVSEYVYKKTSEVIELGLASINDIKDSVIAGQDPKEIAALAGLIGSVTKAIDNLNKVNLQIKQHKNNIEVAKVEASGNKGALLTGPQTNNILIATRDEIMTKLMDKSSKKPTKVELLEEETPIDAEFSEDPQ
jgi:hypothetical protein